MAVDGHEDGALTSRIGLLENSADFFRIRSGAPFGGIADVAENETGDSFVGSVHENVFNPFKLLGAERVA